MSDKQTTASSPSPRAQAILASLRKSVSKAIETKQRLGHYYVQITEDSIEYIGPDAPPNPNDNHL